MSSRTIALQFDCYAGVITNMTMEEPTKYKKDYNKDLPEVTEYVWNDQLIHNKYYYNNYLYNKFIIAVGSYRSDGKFQVDRLEDRPRYQVERENDPPQTQANQEQKTPPQIEEPLSNKIMIIFLVCTISLLVLCAQYDITPKFV